MAAESYSSRTSTEDRAECIKCSKQTLTDILQMIDIRVDQILTACETSSDVKQAFKQNLMQVFSEAFQSNLQVTGADRGNEDSDCMSQESDTEDSMAELMEKYDTQLVNTTQMRRTGPVRIRSLLKSCFKEQLKYQWEVKVLADAEGLEKVDVCEIQTDVDVQDLPERLRQIEQASAETLSKSQNLMDCLRLETRNANSEIGRIMRETPPAVPLETDSCWAKSKISKKLDLW